MLHDVLSASAKMDERRSQTPIELRFLPGLTVEETPVASGITIICIGSREPLRLLLREIFEPRCGQPTSGAAAQWLLLELASHRLSGDLYGIELFDGFVIICPNRRIDNGTNASTAEREASPPRPARRSVVDNAKRRPCSTNRPHRKRSRS